MADNWQNPPDEQSSCFHHIAMKSKSEKASEAIRSHRREMPPIQVKYQ